MFGQLAATVFLIIFSVSLGYLKLRFFGFGQRGLLERQVDYEERRKTIIGKKAHRPVLIRHTESLLHILGLCLVPTVLNGTLLLFLYWRGLYAIVPAIVIPLAILEFFLAQWVQKERRPMYQVDYDRYMLLTQTDNRFVNGHMIKQEGVSSLELSGGRIVEFSYIQLGGLVTNLRLFVSFTTDRLFPVRKLRPDDRVRIFYRSYSTPNRGMNQVINGELLGFQTRTAQLPHPGYEELEQRIAAKY
jgi:hypothetical protein